MVRTQIQLTEEQAKRLKRLAAAKGVSIAALIREAVDRQLLVSSDNAKWERALAVVGAFHSGKSDIGKEHDRYLAEDFLY